MAVLNDLVVQGPTRLVGEAIGTKFIVGGGTSSQFLKADGSLDTAAYQGNVAKLGSATQPLYTSAAGTFATCSTYAGGTKVTLNGANKGAADASFYAPTAAGTSGQVLTSSGGVPAWKTGELDHYLTNVSGTVGANNNRTTWVGTADGVTSLYSGLRVTFKLPCAGAGGGDTLNINSLGEHPLVHNVSSMLTTHYASGATISVVYDASTSCSVYVNGTASAITGCLTLRIYDANDVDTDRIYYGMYSAATIVYPYKILFTKNDTTLLAVNATDSTATTKTLTTESFDPFGQVYLYYRGSSTAAGTTFPYGSLYIRYSNVIDLRYSFNAGSTLTARKNTYVVLNKQSDGTVKLDSTNPISQSLPTTEDGKLYMLLGVAYDGYRIAFYDYHPIYFYKGGSLSLYVGDYVTTSDFEANNETISAALNYLNDAIGDVEELLSNI